jgi:tetratricopeptide (TPR) repeat protein
MASELIQIDARKPLARALVIFLIILSFLWAFFVVRWYLGNTVAEYMNPEENGEQMAQLAVRLAPNDPLAHWRLGDFTEKNLPPEQIGDAVSEYEKATSLAPHDYRFWLSFGRALEQAGETDRAEAALRRAVALAPSYAYPRWYLGNLLLRGDRLTEGLSELQQASEANPELRPQLFNMAWEVFKDDFESMKSAVGKTSEARAQFSLYLVGRGQFEQGMRLWTSLSEAEKKANRETGEAIVTALVTAGQYHGAVEIWNQIAPDINHRAVIGEMFDGSFESGAAHGASSVFSWQVKSQPQAQIVIDPNVGHNSSRSLRFVFQVRAKLDSIDVSQLVPVEPNTDYDFECYLKTNRLDSAGTLFLTVNDAADGTALVTSPTSPSGTNDWQRLALNFKTGPKTQGIRLRINRAGCGDEPVCPIFGTIWYDDFNLKPRS